MKGWSKDVLQHKNEDSAMEYKNKIYRYRFGKWKENATVMQKRQAEARAGENGTSATDGPEENGM